VPLQAHYYSVAPNTAQILCWSFTPKCHRRLRVKDLSRVPAWRLEQALNPRPYTQEATNLPKSHHAHKRWSFYLS